MWSDTATSSSETSWIFDSIFVNGFEMSKLVPEKALIFRIVHADNLDRILEGGLHCRNSPEADPAYRNIGSPEIISNRIERSVPIAPGGVFADYVPFYFTPFSIMLYNLKTGYNVPQIPNDEILIFVASLRTLVKRGHMAVFTDQHGCAAGVEFSSDLERLSDLVDWPLLRSKNFSRDPEDPGKVLRYQAEAMIHQHVPLQDLTGLVCYSEGRLKSVKAAMNRAGVDLSQLQAKCLPHWYF